MELLNIKEFEELLSLQTETPKNIEETTPQPSSKKTFQEHIENIKYEELKREAEKKYKPEDLPEDYFFSALSELVLK